MKFKFCSGGDCPLWALAALHAATALPAQVFSQLVGHAAAGEDEDEILEILKETSLSSRTEAARAAAVVRWVLRSAWRAGVGGAALARDLHVLGAPRQHAAALVQALETHRAGYESKARENAFVVNRVTDVTASPGLTGTVDVLRLTLHTDDVFTGAQRDHEVLLPRDQAAELLQQLETVYSKMEQLESLGKEQPYG